MEVFVDGEVFTPRHDAETVVRDVTEQLRDRLADENRLVISMCCDGQEVSGVRLEEKLDEPLSRFERVELQTATVSDLAADLLSQATEVLAQARQVQAEVAELLSQGNRSRAMELLSQCFSVWKNAQECLQRATEALGLKLDAIPFEQGTVTEFMDEVAAALRTIREALESRDDVMLSDALTYEFNPLTERWQRLNDAVLEQAADG